MDTATIISPHRLPVQAARGRRRSHRGEAARDARRAGASAVGLLSCAATLGLTAGEVSIGRAPRDSSVGATNMRDRRLARPGRGAPEQVAL